MILFEDQSLIRRWSLLLLAVCAFSGCTTVPVEERAAVREEIHQTLETTLTTMTESDPAFQQKVDAAVGMFASRVSATKIPVVGGGYGIGVLHDKEQNTHTYMNVTRFDVGAGLGAGRFQLLILLTAVSPCCSYRL